MHNIISYVQAYRNQSFTEKPFNNVDALVLAQLSYIDFESVPDLEYDKAKHTIQSVVKGLDIDAIAHSIMNGAKNKRLLLAVASSKRYAELQIRFYVNHIDEANEQQFCAITYYLPNVTYIVFRGTDSTIVGWKEDFNMLFQSPIPSQIAGVNYLRQVLPDIEGRVIVGGHSKGGNIAIYATMNIEKQLQDKIGIIYSFDGPGFREEVLLNKAYQNIKNRIMKFMPQSSMVGILFETSNDYIIIRSKNIWITQHDPYSWEIDAGDFMYLDKPNKSLMKMNHKLNKWIDTLDESEKEKFVEGVYEIYKSCDAKTLDEFGASWRDHATTILRSLKTVDKDTKSYILKTVGSMFKFLVFKNPNKQEKSSLPNKRGCDR